MARSQVPLRAGALGLSGGPHAEVLRQGLAVIERLPAGLYASVPGELAHNAAGSHFRHVHDYYRCFLRDAAEGRIDYDRRVRDERFERDAEHAVAELRATLELLEPYAEERADREVFVRMDAAASFGDEAEEERSWSRSTVGRELRFLLSHTIHHYALIAMILKVQGFECGPEFGVAPSTLQHWARAGKPEAPACAPSPGSAQ